jgi:hypothetical protein
MTSLDHLTSAGQIKRVCLLFGIWMVICDTLINQLTLAVSPVGGSSGDPLSSNPWIDVNDNEDAMIASTSKNGDGRDVVFFVMIAVIVAATNNCGVAGAA